VFAWTALRNYQLSRNLTTAPSAWRSRVPVWAPDAHSLKNAATLRMRAALVALDNEDLPAATRLAAYRTELEVARSLLQRSLLANPVQPGSLAKLAAVRWELDSRDSETDHRDLLAMIATASALATQVPEVQSDLGALLSRMGQIDAAVSYLSRAVTLDPRVAAAAVGALFDAGVDPEHISASLPAVSEVLIALRRPYLASGQPSEYVALLERSLATSPESVLRLYVDVCIEVGQSPHAFEFIQALGLSGHDEVDAPRLLSGSRASRAAGRGDVAVTLAERARQLSPERPIVLHELGLAYLAAGASTQAIRALREAIGKAATSETDRRFRSALYCDLGRAEEQAGHPDRAYDEYRRSLQLDPDARYPRQRLDAMRRFAGTREP
jgi:tetratricopeptide (TPR) repeat protein